MDEKTKEKVVKLIDMFDSWKSVIEEVKRYLDQNVDYFTVSSGPWTIEYDNRKESKEKE